MATIQLYSMATPNGQKASIALEEMELPYEAHFIDIRKGEQFTPEFLAINPNNKIPAIVDPDGPDGEPITVFESGAILIYLAEKSGKLLSSDPRLRMETLQWLFWQVSGLGPALGQFGNFYKFAREQCDHPYPLERFTNESRRVLGVLDKRLAGREYLVGDAYSIADIATFPWIGVIGRVYDAEEKLGLHDFTNVMRWYELCRNRPAALRGAKVCAPN